MSDSSMDRMKIYSGIVESAVDFMTDQQKSKYKIALGIDRITDDVEQSVIRIKKDLKNANLDSDYKSSLLRFGHRLNDIKSELEKYKL